MLQEKMSDFLFFDLVDERFSLIKIGNSYVTRSVSLLENRVVAEGVRTVDKDEYVDGHGNN